MRAQSDPASLHHWRKQVKYFGNVLHMLKPLRPTLMAQMARKADALAGSLGLIHDLDQLRRQGTAWAGSRRDRLERFLQALERRDQRQRLRALRLREQLFDSSPAALTRRLHRYWRQWRSSRSK